MGLALQLINLFGAGCSDCNTMRGLAFITLAAACILMVNLHTAQAGAAADAFDYSKVTNPKRFADMCTASQKSSKSKRDAMKAAAATYTDARTISQKNDENRDICLSKEGSAIVLK